MAKQEAVVLYSSTVMVEKDLVPSLWGGNSCCGLGDREVQYSTVHGSNTRAVHISNRTARSLLDSRSHMCVSDIVSSTAASLHWRVDVEG